LATPRIPAQAVSLRHLHPQVTARAIGGNTCVVSAASPGSPVKGDLWVNPANNNQLSQWSGSQWNAVSLNAGSLTGENFNISPTGQFHYTSPPAYATWSFESGLAGWAAAGATITPSDAQANVGAYSALLTYTSGSSWSASSPQQAVAPGVQVYTAAWVYGPQALGAVGLQLAWYNSGGTLLSTSSAATAALDAGVWTQLTFNAAAPASAATVVIVVRDDEASVTGYQMYIDDVYISGQLAVAIAPAAGADLLGSAHPAGVSAIGQAGRQAALWIDSNNVPLVSFASGVPEESTPGRMQVQIEGPGDPTESLSMYLVPPVVTGQTGIPNVILESASKDLSIGAGGVLAWQSGGGNYEALGWDGSAVTVGVPLNVSAGITTAASSLSGGIIISQADNAFTSQSNPTSPSRICKVWPIPEGDPVEGTAYRLWAPFSGTWEGIALTFNIAAFGQSLAAVTVGGDLMSAGLGYSGDLTATLIISQTGSSGILAGSVRVNIGVSAGSQLPSPAGNGAGGFVGVSVAEPVSGIGASAGSMTVQASFASGSSSQSVNGYGSVFERIGGNA